MEAGFSLQDCAAIAYVLRARARVARCTVTDMALRYTALKAHNDRARFARELPAGDLEEWNRATNRLWRDVRRTARAALRGAVPNPTPGARHWGARNLPNDVKRATRAVEGGRWKTIEAETRNAFYAEGGSHAQ